MFVDTEAEKMTHAEWRTRHRLDEGFAYLIIPSPRRRKLQTDAQWRRNAVHQLFWYCWLMFLICAFVYAAK